MKQLTLLAAYLLFSFSLATPSLMAQEHAAPAEEHQAAGATEAAAGEHAEGHSLFEEVSHYVNFLVLLGVIIYGIKKGLVPYLNERGRLIREDMQKSAEAIEQANVRLAAMEERMSNLDRELAQLQTAGMDEARKERARIEKEAEAEASKILAAASMEMDSAVKAARQDLQSYASQLALTVAEKKIQAELTPQSDKQILNAFIDRLGKDGAAADAGRKN